MTDKNTFIESNDVANDTNSDRIKANKEIERRGRPRGRKTNPETLTRKRLAKILMATKDGLSRREIAKRENVSPGAIQKVVDIFSPVFKELKNVEEFRRKRAEIIDAAQILALQSLVDKEKHSDATLNSAAYALDILYKVGRLERGQSTSNTAIHYFDRDVKPSHHMNESDD